jgi:hypothetical protein
MHSSRTFSRKDKTVIDMTDWKHYRWTDKPSLRNQQVRRINWGLPIAVLGMFLSWGLIILAIRAGLAFFVAN